MNKVQLKSIFPAIQFGCIFFYRPFTSNPRTQATQWSMAFMTYTPRRHLHLETFAGLAATSFGENSHTIMKCAQWL